MMVPRLGQCFSSLAAGSLEVGVESSLHPEGEATQPTPSSVLSTFTGSSLTSLTSCVVRSHWSRLIEARLSLVESFIVLLRQCLLCHKEPARRIQSPLLGALERKKPPTRGFLLAPRWFFMA